MVAAADLPRRAIVEGIGTALLLATIVGSGIMGDDLSKGNAAVALLANSIATGAALVALILVLAPISGAHFNPWVTVAMAVRSKLAWRDVPAYVGMQLGGAFAGVAIANAMFSKPVFFASTHVRSSFPQLLAEVVATFGLLFVIGSVKRSWTAPFAVGAWITAAYWFTSSTSFANGAVTLARSATDTFAGIRPIDVPGFVVAQAVGAAIATVTLRFTAKR